MRVGIVEILDELNIEFVHLLASLGVQSNVFQCLHLGDTNMYPDPSLYKGRYPLGSFHCRVPNEVTVKGIFQKLDRTDLDIEGIFKQGDCWIQFDLDNRI